jgi:hypothetical protein
MLISTRTGREAPVAVSIPHRITLADLRRAHPICVPRNLSPAGIRNRIWQAIDGAGKPMADLDGDAPNPNW